MSQIESREMDVWVLKYRNRCLKMERRDRQKDRKISVRGCCGFFENPGVNICDRQG